MRDPLGEIPVAEVTDCVYGRFDNTMLPGRVVGRAWRIWKFVPHAFFKTDIPACRLARLEEVETSAVYELVADEARGLYGTSQAAVQAAESAVSQARCRSKAWSMRYMKWGAHPASASAHTTFRSGWRSKTPPSTSIAMMSWQPRMTVRKLFSFGPRGR